MPLFEVGPEKDARRGDNALTPPPWLFGVGIVGGHPIEDRRGFWMSAEGLDRLVLSARATGM